LASHPTFQLVISMALVAIAIAGMVQRTGMDLVEVMEAMDGMATDIMVTTGIVDFMET